jgi:RNA polymerase sigma-70 factor (ECF subfamily)
MAFRMMGDRHEAEDAVQDTMRSAWKSRERFDRRRSARAWLVAILRRRIIDRWRRRPRPGLMAAGQELDVAVTDRDPLADGYTDRMQQALGSLNDQLRETLLLVVVAELTHQETADLLDVPLGTVLSRVSRARQRLRQFLLAEARQE